VNKLLFRLFEYVVPLPVGALKIGEFANLPGIIDKLIEAARAGELDDQFAQTSAERGLLPKRVG